MAACAALVLVALAALAGVARGAAAGAPRVTVDLKGDRFSKRTIRVVQGTTVRYRFLDPGPEGRHNVRPDPFRQGRTAGAPASPSRGLGGAPFDFTFRSVGTYRLYCSLHPAMKHDVVVVKPA
jgi:plastocyanin